MFALPVVHVEQRILNFINSFFNYMPRNSYQKILQNDKKTLREKCDRGQTFVHFAKLLSMNRKTAYSIVLRDEDAPAHGGKNQMFDEDTRDYLIEYLECNTLLTLRQLNAKLQHHFAAKLRSSDKP